MFIPPHLIHVLIRGAHIAVVEGPKWVKNDVIPKVNHWQEERARRRIPQEYENAEREQERARRKAEELSVKAEKWGVDLPKGKDSGPGSS
jgi:hypothetical protein